VPDSFDRGARSLRLFDSVSPGPLYRCAQPDRKRPADPCGGLLSVVPEVGAVLLAIMDLAPGERLEVSDRERWAAACGRCHRWYVFASARAA
jgi:hypothetical protein